MISSHCVPWASQAFLITSIVRVGGSDTVRSCLPFGLRIMSVARKSICFRPSCSLSNSEWVVPQVRGCERSIELSVSMGKERHTSRGSKKTKPVPAARLKSGRSPIVRKQALLPRRKLLFLNKKRRPSRSRDGVSVPYCLQPRSMLYLPPPSAIRHKKAAR